MPIAPVEKGKLITASHQNELIDRVNDNTVAIENLSVPGGDLEEVEELIEESITLHVDALTPHPAYDDLPSLQLLFENGLV